MATNALPDALDPLFTLAEDMADGAHTHETAIGLKQNKEADIRADLAAARSAQSDPVTGVEAKKLAKKNASAAQQVADSNGKAFIALTKKMLGPGLGDDWTPEWGAVGFPASAVAIPGTIAERQELLKKISLWLAANPAREITASGILFTAAAGGAEFDALSGARSDFNQKTTDQSTAILARDAARTALETRMRGLINELSQRLPDTDPRWYAFGLNAPGDAATPGIPDGLVLTPGTGGTLYADWADSRRGSGYHVWRLVVGVDNAFVKVATVTDSNATLTNQPLGKLIKIQITAYNAAGDSQPSETAEVTL